MSRIARPEAEEPTFLERLTNPTARRTFLKWAGASGAVLAIGCGDDDGDGGMNNERVLPPIPPTGDTEILQFALFLELLEADFYNRAIAAGILSGKVAEVATDVRDHENTHVQTLQTALGSASFSEDDVAFDFGGALASQAAFLAAAETFEQTGVGAYLGQIGRISNKSTRTTAGSIYTIEARHTAAFRALNGKPDPAPRAFETPLDAQTVVSAIAPFVTKGA